MTADAVGTVWVPEQKAWRLQTQRKPNLQIAAKAGGQMEQRWSGMCVMYADASCVKALQDRSTTTPPDPQTVRTSANAHSHMSYNVCVCVSLLRACMCVFTENHTAATFPRIGKITSILGLKKQEIVMNFTSGWKTYLEDVILDTKREWNTPKVSFELLSNRKVSVYYLKMIELLLQTKFMSLWMI